MADKVFMEAVAGCARYHKAGIDSAVRHHAKGDVNKYYERTASNRTSSWRSGYTFARNVILHNSCSFEHYSKDGLGDSIHEQEINLLCMLGVMDDVMPGKSLEYSANESPLPPTAMDTEEVLYTKEHARLSGMSPEHALKSLGIEYTKTSLCLWFDMVDNVKDQLEKLGAKKSGKREAKGKPCWYFDVRMA